MKDINENPRFISEGPCTTELIYSPYRYRQNVSTHFQSCDTMDLLLREMLANPHCSWIMLTKGNNLYNQGWLDEVNKVLVKNSDIRIVSWESVDAFDNSVKPDLTKEFGDISNYLITSSLFSRSSINSTEDLHAVKPRT